MSRVIRTAGTRRAGGLSIACSLLHVRPSLTDAELDWALPHGELYGFPSRAGVFAAFSMPGENRFRIFGASHPVPRVRTSQPKSGQDTIRLSCLVQLKIVRDAPRLLGFAI
jgi:hypothetical protein